MSHPKNTRQTGARRRKQADLATDGLQQRGHGGYRPGAGRKPKSGRPGEKSVVMRIPEGDKMAVESLLAARWQHHTQQPDQREISHATTSRAHDRLQSRSTASIMSDSVQLAAMEPLRLALPLFANRVPAGFPSPADDYVEDTLDLNQQLVRNPAATFFVRVQGNSMTGAGIFDGDTLVVDRAITPRSGNIVVAVVDGELTVKRLFQRQGKTRLLPENPEFAPIEFTDGQELVIWGVVTNVIHPVL
jgi:DNA polymerase V